MLIIIDKYYWKFNLAIEVYRKYDSKIGKTNADFKEFIENDKNFIDDICLIANDVQKFTSQFDIPGNEII